MRFFGLIFLAILLSASQTAAHPTRPYEDYFANSRFQCLAVTGGVPNYADARLRDAALFSLVKDRTDDVVRSGLEQAEKTIIEAHQFLWGPRQLRAVVNAKKQCLESWLMNTPLGARSVLLQNLLRNANVRWWLAKAAKHLKAEG